jgi:hypothetical protein
LPTKKAFKKYKIGNEYGKDHSLVTYPSFLWGVVPGAPKKEPEPSGEGPGMIRPVVPGAWV